MRSEDLTHLTDSERFTCEHSAQILISKINRILLTDMPVALQIVKLQYIYILSGLPQIICPKTCPHLSITGSGVKKLCVWKMSMIKKKMWFVVGLFLFVFRWALWFRFINNFVNKHADSWITNFPLLSSSYFVILWVSLCVGKLVNTINMTSVMANYQDL